MPMNAAKLLLLNVLSGGGGSPVTYLFRDEFTTDEAAPLASPRTAEPGPGELTVVQTHKQYSIGAGALNVPSPGSTAWNLVGHYSTAIARAAGVALIAHVKVGPSGDYVLVAWATSGALNTTYSSNVECGLYLNTLSVLSIPESGPLPGGSWTRNTDYIVAIIVRSHGAFHLIKGGAFSDWTMVWNSKVGTTSPLYYLSATAEAAYTQNFVRCRQLPAPFDTDNGIATLNVASPTDATEYTGDADGIIDLTVIAPGTLDGSASTRCGFYYRADSDTSPSWHAYVDGTGAFNLDSIDAAGTRTNRITAAGVITGGATRTLRVIADGTKHNAYTLNSTTWTKHGLEINVSLNDAVTRIIPSIPAGWTGANLQSFPRTSPAYAELDRE